MSERSGIIVKGFSMRRGLYARRVLALAALAALGACASKEQGYGVGPQAQAELQMRQSVKDPAPDTPGMYLGLIQRMQAQGLYYASLAHIDAYEREYGTSPDSIVLRADALRMTGQTEASAAAYARLLATSYAARGHRGLGLLAGASGDFHRAARELNEAAQREPTDAATLSDLGYALLRDGNVADSRVPLLKAIELDPHNPKIAANVALYFVANGEPADAQALMDQQALPADTRAAVARDARKVGLAQRARKTAHVHEALASVAVSLPPRPTDVQAGGPGADLQSRLLQRGAQ